MEREIEWLGSIKNEHHRLTTFYQIWGLKESYIKAIGKGLALDLDRFCIMPSRAGGLTLFTKDKDASHGHWCIHLSYLDSQSISVVCCGSNNHGFLLDRDLVRFAETTANLGDLYNGQPSIFTRLSLQSLLSDMHASYTPLVVV